MSKRTIQSPGVEIRESDLSLRTVSQGTTTYITGFADQGPTDEVVGVSNINEFEQIYGSPRTPAERYFYHTARATLNSTGSLLVNRLPYGDSAGTGFGSYYSVLAYPARGYDRTAGVATQYFTVSAGSYFLGAPKQYNITEQQYLQLKSGELFSTGWSASATAPSGWSTLTALSGAALIVVNKSQTVIDGQFNGYYLGIADNTNINPASAFESILSVETVTQSAGAAGIDSYTTVPTSRLEFALSATPEFGDNPATNSISQVMEDRITGYDISTREFDDALNIGVFKLRQSVFSKEANRLDYLLEEGYNGSIGYYRQRNSDNGGAPINYFLENVENDSRNIDIIVNPFLSDQISGVNLNPDGTPRTKLRVLTQSLADNFTNGNLPSSIVGAPLSALTAAQNAIGTADSVYALGAYGETTLTGKVAGNIPQKLDRALDRIKNDRKFNIDIIAEGGIGSIWTYNQTATAALSIYGYDDTRTTAAIEALRTSSDLGAVGTLARTA